MKKRVLLIAFLSLIGLFTLPKTSTLLASGAGLPRTAIGNFFRGFNNAQNHLFFLNAGYRCSLINSASRGYWQTGQPLISVDRGPDGKDVFRVTESIGGDDLGIYYITPKISRLLHQKDAAPKIYVLLSLILWLAGFILTYIGVRFLIPNARAQLFAFGTYAAFAILNLYILDVYIANYFVVSSIPITLFLYKQGLNKDKFCFSHVGILLALSGALIGTCNLIRSHSGTGLLIFLMIYLLLQPSNNCSFHKKICVVGALLFFCTLPGLYIKFIQHQRDGWLLAHHIKSDSYISSHVFWHNVYMGLGYVRDNPYHIQWNDQYGFDLANRIDPGMHVSSNQIPPNYDSIIRNEFFSLLQKDPLFVAKTLLLKMIQTFGMILLFFNVGIFLVFSKKFRPNNALSLAFIVTVCFCLLPGILVWPFPMYLTSAMGFAMISTWLMVSNYFENESVPKKALS